MTSAAETREVTPPPHEAVNSEARDDGWRLDLVTIGIGSLALGLGLAALVGVWSPWEALIAQSLEHMSAEGSWLTVHIAEGDGVSFKSAPLLPFGWWLSALCYQQLPTELGLRLPHVLFTSLCALSIYSAARHCFDLLGERHARRSALGT